MGAGALPPTPAPPSPLVPLKRETLDATDLLYLKNGGWVVAQGILRLAGRCWPAAVAAGGASLWHLLACPCRLVFLPRPRGQRPRSPSPTAVLLKFLDAQLGGRTQECEVLLPAVATLLRASPQEFRVLREAVQRAGGGAGVLSEWFGTSVGGTR